MDRFLDLVGLRRQAPQGGQPPQHVQQHPGVAPTKGHGHIGPAPALTPATQAITKSAETALHSIAETETLLKNLMGGHIDALALEKINEPHIREIAIQLFGLHSPLMAAVGCMEDGVAYRSFLVPTQQVDSRDVLHLAEALEIAAPDIAAELCASAGMSLAVSPNNRILLLEKCVTLIHEKAVVLSPLILNELIKGLARACENMDERELVKPLLQLICDSLSESEQVKYLTENLIGAFNESARNDDQQGAQEAVDVLERLPYAHARHAVAQLRAEQEVINAQCEWDDAAKELKTTGFHVRIENVRGEMPKKLLNSGGELDSRAKRTALVNYAIKLAAIPGHEQWVFCMLFDLLQKNDNLLDFERSKLQAAHCQVLACFIRDDDKNAKVRLQIFREDFARRLRVSIEGIVRSVDSYNHVRAPLMVQEWAYTSFDCILADKALPETFRFDFADLYPPDQDKIIEIVGPFVEECVKVCAHAAIAPMPELLEPVFSLIDYTCLNFNFDRGVVIACLDVAANSNVTNRFRQKVIKMLDTQIDALRFSCNPEVEEFCSVSGQSLFTRVAKAMALFDAETDGDRRVSGLSINIKRYPFYWDPEYQSGFSSKHTSPEIAAHMIQMSRYLRAGLGSKAVHEEILGEYLYRFMRAGTDMHGLVKQVLVELVSCLHHEFSSIILGATHNGEPAQIHALLQLSLECNFNQVKDLANLVSDLLLELAQAGHLDPLKQAIALVREKSVGILEVWAVAYVRAAQRNQPMLVKLMRREILHLDLELLFDNRDYLKQITNMARESIATEQHDNPRRPLLHRDPKNSSSAGMKLIIKRLKRLLMFHK